MELGTATVHHQRVVTGPTPPWYRERRGSHSRMFAMCEARNDYAVFTCSVDSGNNITSSSSITPGVPGNIVSATTICGTSSWLLGGKSSSVKNTLLLAGGSDYDAIGEKERNPSPVLLVATGWESWIISFARSAAEVTRVAWIGADDDELLLVAASDNAETRSAVSAWVAILLLRRLIRKSKWKLVYQPLKKSESQL